MRLRLLPNQPLESQVDNALKRALPAFLQALLSVTVFHVTGPFVNIYLRKSSGGLWIAAPERK